MKSGYRILTINCRSYCCIDKMGVWNEKESIIMDVDTVFSGDIDAVDGSEGGSSSVF